MIKKFQLKKFMEEKKLLKVISGMENFDQENIRMVVNAATLGFAQAIDISADSSNIRWVKENHTKLIIFVSSLSPAMLVQAKEWGADVLELGNFDALYTQGKSISKEEVIALTRELRTLAGDETMICISIPGNLEIDQQVELALQVQAAGADILQVENLLADSDYANAQAIAEAVEIPVMLSGKIDSNKIEKALASGVNAIGIGHAINSKTALPLMVEEVKASMKVLNSDRVAV
jgi:thiamine monophosphate synthase